MSWEHLGYQGNVMQRIKWVDERLQQWAHWRMAGGGGYRSPSFCDTSARYTGDVFNSYVEVSADHESQALEMDQAIASLPRDLGKAVIAHYTWEGGADIIASKLGVTRATVHRRLCHADLRISSWLDARAEIEKSLREKHRA